MRTVPTTEERGTAGDIWLMLPDGSEHPLRCDVTIGRGDENDLVLKTTTVSREHARLAHKDGRWFIEDLGSRNGTFVNTKRIPAHRPYSLHHADRIDVGSETLVFSWLTQSTDPDDTHSMDSLAPVASRPLSPFQQQVVGALCQPWLDGASLDRLPTNEEIAAEIGTPGAADTVKAALRRAYAKAGLTEGLPHAKRRALCRVARQRGWI
ncbi:MAG: FHA domain-containing protein [Actinomycetota bacterium]|nr:FHA domain-containing protein [Actinomycetota bacterium]